MNELLTILGTAGGFVGTLAVIDIFFMDRKNPIKAGFEQVLKFASHFIN